jgi:hypothetical protein
MLYKVISCNDIVEGRQHHRAVFSLHESCSTGCVCKARERRAWVLDSSQSFCDPKIAGRFDMFQVKCSVDKGTTVKR